jgi:hypothetical protein
VSDATSGSVANIGSFGGKIKYLGCRWVQASELAHRPTRQRDDAPRMQFSEVSFAIVWRLSRVQNYVARAARGTVCPPTMSVSVVVQHHWMALCIPNR